MGGGGQSNSRQASESFQGGQAASAQDMALSQQNAAEQKLIFDKLFGSGGKPGTLTSFLDPKNLTQSTFNPAYQATWNQSQNQIGKDYANQRGSLAQSFANNGATSNSTPTGFQADQMNKLSRGEADTRGATYTGLKGAQYQDALNNFWNANNVATGQAAGARSGALQGSGQSGSVQDQLYGTAGAYHSSPYASIPGAALGAGGTVGAAAMCPATGSLVLMADNAWKKIEDLRKGDHVFAIDGSVDELLEDPLPSAPADIVLVCTRKYRARVSYTHWFDRSICGYTLAAESLGQKLKTLKSQQEVVEVTPLPEKSICWDLTLSPSHSYCVDGFWSLG